MSYHNEKRHPIPEYPSRSRWAQRPARWCMWCTSWIRCTWTRWKPPVFSWWARHTRCIHKWWEEDTKMRQRKSDWCTPHKRGSCLAALGSSISLWVVAVTSTQHLSAPVIVPRKRERGHMHREPIQTLKYHIITCMRLSVKWDEWVIKINRLALCLQHDLAWIYGKHVKQKYM